MGSISRPFCQWPGQRHWLKSFKSNWWCGAARAGSLHTWNMKTQQEQQVQTTQPLLYHINAARHEKLEVKLISSELCCDKLQNFSGLEEKSALYTLLIICYTCCSAIKSLRTLHILQLLLSRHVGLLLHRCHHAVVLLPAASGDGDVHLAFPPAFTRLLCDAITSEATGMKTVKSQTFMRNREPL